MPLCYNEQVEGKYMIVHRRELKYPLNILTYQMVDKLLKEMLTKDKNSMNGDYFIRSLYFDTFNNHDFYSKMNGDVSRKKIRLRIYDLESEQVKLEIKRKEDINQTKESIWINKDDAKSLIKGNYSVLLKYNSEIAKTIYNIMTLSQYRPVVMVDYYRRAYYHRENNIRLTLDRDIRSCESNFDIFNKSLMLTPVFNEGFSILEVKYNSVMFRWIKDVLNGLNLSNQSISKYCSSRTWLA